jgi:hypothetical protein
MPAVARCRSPATVDQENTVARTRRSVTSIAAVAVAAAVAFGVGAAIAQDETPASGTDPAALLARLGELEVDLPADFAPTAATLSAEASFGTIEGDATSVRALLDTLETPLRQLFIDADDADGPVADAVSLVAQGWLDVWTGSASIGAAQSNDLAFPTEATDGLDVAAGADELRGSFEIGLELVLQGRARHLAGYEALRDLNEAEPPVQALLDARATASKQFDEEVRPDVVAALGASSTSIMVPTERFVTDAPGVRSRATSMTVMCVDRESYERAIDEATGPATDGATDGATDAAPDGGASIEVQRDDCPPAADELTAADDDE